MEKNKYFIILNVIVTLFLLSWIFSYFIDFNNDTNDVKVAVIPIFGVIHVGSIGSYFSDGFNLNSGVNSYAVVNQIKKSNDNPSIKYIILDINSPGGSPVGSEEIMEAVKNSKKPVFTIIRDIGTSGAYWVASASTKVFSSPISLVGGIGVTASYVQISGFMKKYGFGYERLVSGEYKDTATIFRNMTKNETKMMMKKIMIINDYFANSVAKNRNLSKNLINKIDNGEVFTGEEAVKYHLVDGLGTFIDLLNQINEKQNKTVKLVTYYKKPSLLQLILNSKSYLNTALINSISSALNKYLNNHLNSETKFSLR